MTCKIKHRIIYASNIPPFFHKDAVNVQDSVVRILSQAVIQMEQTSAEGLRAALFPEAEQ